MVLRDGLSPSSRRAWIEIYKIVSRMVRTAVALLTEGVDRNGTIRLDQAALEPSPSSRRAWIEIAWVLFHAEDNSCRPPHGGRG